MDTGETMKGCDRSFKEQTCRKVYPRIETEPGLQAQVDLGKFKVTDDNGKTATVYVFVLFLSYSRAMYIEFVDHLTLRIIVDCHIRAFEHLCGVPAEVLYHNRVDFVAGGENGKPRINVKFMEFARHYGFAPRLCPPVGLGVKGVAERQMNCICKNFLAGYAFSYHEQATRDVMRWKQEVADQRTRDTDGQVIARWQEEIPCLGELPPTHYDTSMKTFRKVRRGGLIFYDGNKYYVAETIGKKVLLKVKGRDLYIYDGATLLKQYQIPGQKGKALGMPKHRSV